MENLFNDSETFQKDRPTKATDTQIEKMYSNLADEVIQGGWGYYSKNDIVTDLKCIDFNDDVFDKAKEMDDSGGYNMTIEFMEWLDNLCWEKGNLIEKNVKEWVKAHEIKPTYEQGTKLIVTTTINRQIGINSIVYINGYRLDTACYLVDKDKDKKGGTVLPYEKVNDCTNVV